MVFTGIDGCPSGWIAARFDGSFSFFTSDRLEDLVKDDITVVDIPFGLIDTYPRPADVAARNHLCAYGKAASVFPSPLRPVLECDDYPTANALSRSLCGKGLTKQTYMLFDRIRQAEVLAATCAIYEGHPELSFSIWSGTALPPKRTVEGATARLQLIRSQWPSFEIPVIPGATANDILDAVALVWTASRIFEGAALTYPDPPVVTPGGRRSTIYA
jgi:predicted RNase H-like nuclease